MRKYEIMTIIKPNMDIDEVDKVVEKIEEMITSFGGKIESTDKMGRKKLSFDVKNFRDGFFVVEKVELDPAKVAEVRRQLTLNENVIRIMILETSEVKA